MKNKYHAIRTEIAKRAEYQKLQRKLRKTVHNPYSREQQAAFKAQAESLAKSIGLSSYYPEFYNRLELMHLYIAYRIIKGKEPIYPTKQEYSQAKIDKLVEKFKPKEILN